MSDTQARATYLVLAAACIGATVWIFFFHHVSGGDYWEHAAALRAWSQDLVSPGNPQLLTPEPSPRYTPLTFPVAALTAAFGWPVDAGMAVTALLNAVLILTGIYVFARAYFRHRFAPVVLLVVLLGAWGIEPLQWSSAYSAPSLVAILPYSSAGAFGAALLVLALLIRLMTPGTKTRAAHALLAAGTAIVISAHLLTGAFLLGVAGAFLAFSPRPDWHARKICAAALAAGFALAFLWPFYDLLGVLMERRRDTSWFLQPSLRGAPVLDHPFYGTEVLLKGTGLAMLGVVSAGWFALRRREPLYMMGICVFALPYLANIFVYIPLGHRFLVFAVFFMHLALTHHGLLLLKYLRRKGFKGAASAQVAAMGGAVAIAAGTAFAIAQAPGRLSDDAGAPVWSTESDFKTSDIARLAARIPGGAVVAGDERFTWRLGAHGVYVLSLNNPNPLVEDYGIRSIGNAVLMSPDTDRLVREAVIARYDVTHLLLHPALLNRFSPLEAQEAWLGAPAAVEGRLHLYKVPAPSAQAEALAQSDAAFERRLLCERFALATRRAEQAGSEPPRWPRRAELLKEC